MPDLVKAIKGRKKKLEKIWSSEEWKGRKAAFLFGHPWCEMHYKEGIKVRATVPHHPYRNATMGHYTDLELSQCVAYCKSCHFALHKGRKLCPVCKENYPRWDQEMCWSCFCIKNPGIIEKIEEKQAKDKAKQKELRDLQKKKAQAWKAKNKKVSP